MKHDVDPRARLQRLAPLLLLALGACRAEPADATSSTTGGAAITAPAPTPAARAGGEGWNSAQIAWQPYEAGLAAAKAQGKPVCLVFSTSWCPHCKNFSHVFDDPKVVERARDFVMIHLDADEESAVASKYARDGTYIPRTFFLAPDGTADFDIHAPRDKYRYFYDEKNPTALLAGMEEAARKLRK